MKAWDFDCVVYDGAYFCSECLPDGVDIEDEEVAPVFASDEVYGAPVCDQCGYVHYYMSILGDDDDDES